MKKYIFLLIFISHLCFGGEVHLGPGQSYPNVEAAFNASAILPGDTVFLHEGTFRGYQGIVGLKGSADNWIVFMPFSDNVIEIKGGWQFQACEYLKFIYLIFVADSISPGRLINVDNNGSCTTQSRFIKFDGCSFMNVTDTNAITSFKFGGVDNFEVTNCFYRNLKTCSAFDFNVCHKGIISNNKIMYCMTGGHIKGGASDILMERNAFLWAGATGWPVFELGGDTGQQFYCPGDSFEVKNLKFYSNIINGGDRGLALSSAVDCKVINNTIYNNSNMTMRFLTTSTKFPTMKGNRVENNLFVFGLSAYMNGSKQHADAVTFTKNIYFHFADSSFVGPYWDKELDSIKEKNPLNYGSNTNMFFNPTSGSFILADSSPALGAGMDESEPELDYYGNKYLKPRSIGAVDNMFANSVFDQSFNVQNDIIIIPNPASNFLEITFGANGCSPLQDIEIFNVFGEKVLSTSPQPSPFMEREESPRLTSSTTPQEGNLRIDVSSLSPGVYFIKVGEKVGKFVKM